MAYNLNYWVNVQSQVAKIKTLLMDVLFWWGIAWQYL